MGVFHLNFYKEWRLFTVLFCFFTTDTFAVFRFIFILQVEKQQCKDIPRQQCTKVARQEEKEQCHKVPREVCEKIPREVCEQIPAQSCVKVTFTPPVGGDHTSLSVAGTPPGLSAEARGELRAGAQRGVRQCAEGQLSASSQRCLPDCHPVSCLL